MLDGVPSEDDYIYKIECLQKELMESKATIETLKAKLGKVRRCLVSAQRTSGNLGNSGCRECMCYALDKLHDLIFSVEPKP